jgi:hypothetical protein
MYSVASIEACDLGTIDCFDVPLNQSIASAEIWRCRVDLAVVDLVSRNELVDLNGPGALDLHSIARIREPNLPRSRGSVGERWVADAQEGLKNGATLVAIAAVRWIKRLPVTLLIRADEFCIGQYVALHCSLDLRFCRVS